MEEISDQLNDFVEKVNSLDDSERVEFILFHGSRAEGRGLQDSDVDVCIGYNGDERSQSEFRLRILQQISSNFDVQMFRLLPLNVRVQVLRGAPVYVKNARALYETALQTIREYESFKPHLMEYVGA